MSKKNVKKGNMNLDNELGDLLGTDDDVPAKKTSPTAGRTARTGRGAAIRRTDDTYSKMAAEANDDLPDISDVDPDEILKELDMDDMDDVLFGKKKPVAKKEAPVKDNHLKSKTTAEKKAGPLKAKRNSFDEDDILGGLSLSDIDDDDDDAVKLKKPVLTSALKKPALKTPAEDDESQSQASSGSRRLEVDRPPTRSGKAAKEANRGAKMLAATKKRDDDMFADDDDLGGLLDSPGRAAPNKPSTLKATKKDGGIMDDLLGRDTVGKLLQKPSGGASTERQFKLDKKYTKSAVKPHKAAVKDEDDFLFGSYAPSAAATTGGSRPSSMRSVRFENDKDGTDDQPRTSTSAPPGGRRRSSPSSRLDDMLLEDERDWLDMASDDHTPAKSDDVDGQRPQSEGGHPQKTKPSRDSGKAQTAKSQPVDWLGLSRLGSPDHAPTEPDQTDNQSKTSAAEKTKSVTPTVHADTEDVKVAVNENDDDDLSGIIKSRRAARKVSSPPKTKDDNWSEVKDSKVSNWLGINDSSEMLEDPDLLSRAPQSPSHVSAARKPDTDLFIPPPKFTSDDESPFKWGADRDKRRGRRMERTPPAEGFRKSTELFGDPISDSLKAEPVIQHAGVSHPGTQHRGVSHQVTQQPGMSQPITQQQPVTQYPGVVQPVTQSPGVSQPVMQYPGVSQSVFGAPQMGGMRVELEQQALQEQQLTAYNDKHAKYAASQVYQTPSQLQHQMVLPPPQQLSLGMVTTDDASPNVFLQIRKMEMEKSHLEMMLATLTEQHKVEVDMIGESYKKRISLMEETFARREERLKEEVESISRQGTQRMKLMETEKAELLASHFRKQEEWEQDKTREIERIKELHRDAVMEMRREHEYSMERLKKMKDTEVDAIASTQTHTRSLQAVMEKMEVNMQDLNSLQQKVESKHELTLDRRENAAKTRDDALKTFQDRLERQQHANEMEHGRLEGLVATLEKQLTDQTRELEEERWKVRQEEAKLRSLQHTVTQEKEVMQERHLRDRTEIEKAKDRLIEEQQRIMGELYKERQALAEEKAKFLLDQKLNQDKEHRESLKHLKADADFSSTVKVINDEKAKLSVEERELLKERERLNTERALLEQQQNENERERAKFQQMALRMQQESEAMDSVSKEAAQLREHAEAMLGAAKKKEAELVMRVQRMQQDMETLRAKEKFIIQEKLMLAKDKQDLEQCRSSILCVSCRTPVREGARLQQGVPSQLAVGAPLQQGVGAAFPASADAVSQRQMTPAAQKLFASLPPEFQSHLDSMNNVSAAIATDRTIRMWRIAAEKDKAFLEGEGNFLEMLKYTPYHAANTVISSPQSPVQL